MSGGRRTWKVGRARRVCAALALLGFSLAVSLLLAGCRVGLVTDTTVNTDGSGSMSIRLSADREILEFLASQEVEGRSIDLFEEIEDVLPPGWPLEKGEEPDGTRFIALSLPFVDGGQLAAFAFAGEESPLADLGISRFELVREQSFFTVRTTFRAEIDIAAALSSLPLGGAQMPGEALAEGVSPELISRVFAYEHRLKLPGSLGANNADEIAGRTLIWRPGASTVVDMQAESVALRWGSVASVLVGVAIVFLLAATVAFGVRAKRRSRVKERPPWAR
jgi:hypothetical protein